MSNTPSHRLVVALKAKAKAIKKYKKIENKIEEGLKSKDAKTQQAAAILWLIAETGIRIGNEKDLNVCADTVGASTLKVENIILD